MAKIEYTTEELKKITDIYVERRNLGELNTNIMADLEAQFGKKAASIRMKIKDVYIKDTEEEKGRIKQAKAASKKGRTTKADRAAALAEKLEIEDKETIGDLEKLTVKTFDALDSRIEVLLSEEYVDDSKEYAADQEYISTLED